MISQPARSHACDGATWRHMKSGLHMHVFKGYIKALL